MNKFNQIWVYKDDFKRFFICPKVMWLMRNRFNVQIQKWVANNLTFLDKEMVKFFESQFQYLPQKPVQTELEIRAVSGIWFEKLVFQHVQNQKQTYFFQNSRDQSFSPLEKSAFTKKVIDSKKFSAYYQPYFCYKNYVTKCDLVFDHGPEGLEICEIKAVNKIKTKKRREDFINDLLYQCWIVNKLGYKIQKASILHLNDNYCRQENLDVSKLIVFDSSFSEKVLQLVYQTETNEAIGVILEKIRKYLQISFINLQEVLLNSKCEEKESNVCSHLIRKVESKYNLLQLYRLQRLKKAKFYLDNSSTEIDLEKINLNCFSFSKDQLRSIKVIQGIENIIKSKDKVILELTKYHFPIYFYDFETVSFAIPQFKKTVSWLQIPFQYSVHILVKKPYDLKTGKNIYHLDYIYSKRDDPRKDFINNFLKDAYKFGLGTYVAYNASFEKTVLTKIIEMVELTDDQKTKIQNIIENTIDLMNFFKNFNIYHKNFFGSKSIKKTLPALVPESDLSYKKLKIQTGDQASASYFNYLFELVNEKSWKKNMQHLKNYCELDSLAMLKIYEKINQMIKKPQ